MKLYKAVIHLTVFVEAEDMDDAMEAALDNVENGQIDTCDVEEV